MDILSLSDTKTTIPASCVDLVTVFKPEHVPREEIGATVINVAPIVKASKKILRPGGWIYIAPAPHLDHKNDHYLFKKALQSYGFVNIEVVSHPGISFYADEFRFIYDDTKPNFLVRAQKPYGALTLKDKIPKRNGSRNL